MNGIFYDIGTTSGFRSQTTVMPAHPHSSPTLFFTVYGPTIMSPTPYIQRGAEAHVESDQSPTCPVEKTISYWKCFENLLHINPE